MRNQADFPAQIERLYFWLRVSKEKFNLALNQGCEFSELRSILKEIRQLEHDIKDQVRSSTIRRR